MGSSNIHPQLEIVLSPDTIAQSLRVIKYNPSVPLYTAFRTINAELMKNNLYEVKQNNQTYINPVFLTLWFENDFQKYCNCWFQHWKSLLLEITQTNAILIKLKSWRMVYELTKFLVCLSTDRIYYILNNIGVIALHPQSKSIVKKFSSSSFDEQNKTTFISKLSRSQAQQLYKCLLIVLSNFLSLKTSTFSRSEPILQQITIFSQTSFAIFCRVYFSQFHHQLLRKRAIKVNNEANIQHLAYFLGSSLETKNSSLFDISILFCLSLIIGNKTNPSINNLPSHLFKTLPTSTTNNIYDFILQTSLLALTYKKPNNTVRVQCNRMNTLRLCYYLVQYSLATITDLAIDYLLNICSFTKSDQLQRVFLAFLIDQSLKLKQSQSMRKFSAYFNKPFQIALANTELKYEPKQLVQHFINHEDYFIEQMQTFYYNYMEENILRKNKNGLFQQKIFWQRLLNSKRDNKVTC